MKSCRTLNRAFSVFSVAARGGRDRTEILCKSAKESGWLFSKSGPRS